MHLRPAIPADAATLSRIAYAAKASWGYPEAELRNWKSGLTVRPETVQASPTFVAEVGGEIAGFYQLKSSASPWELEHLWVHPNHMRQGIGRALLRHAAGQAAEAGQTILAIDADPQAEPFYQACGARRVGAVPAPIAGQPQRVRPQLELPILNPHRANQDFWDATVKWWQEKEDQRGLWQKAHQDPALVLSPAELAFVRDVAGKDVCVLGSGDNEVAFALAGLGGRVTSVDISERRLTVAAERARTLGLQVTFVQADVTNLAALQSNSFDLVYEGGHVTIWISDIRKFFAEAVRILRPGGLFVVNEYHPLRRVWVDAAGAEPADRYFHRGPYPYTSPEGLPTFEYHWTVADHIQAVIDAGCRIVQVDEHGEKIGDEFWTKAKLDKLPGYLLVVGKKERL